MEEVQTSPDFNIGYFLSSLIAGALSGIAVELVLFPIDSIKTRLQQGRKRGHEYSLYTDLYSGLLSALAATIPCAATFWCTYNVTKVCVIDMGFPEGPFANGISAFIGSFTSSLVQNPFEVVKQQLQVRLHSSECSAPLEILTKQGLWGLFVGFDALLLRELPFDTIQLLTYEALVSVVDPGSSLLIHQMYCGAMSGAVASFITTPIDVIKTRLMTQASLKGKDKVCADNFMTAGDDIVSKDGWLGLMAGCGPRVLFTTIGGVIYFGTFEYSFWWLESAFASLGK